MPIGFQGGLTGALFSEFAFTLVGAVTISMIIALTLTPMMCSCGIRLRPILMTTGAMVLGVAPLILASGAGAASRYNMGLVIATGLAIGTLFTLFVVPAVYMVLAADHRKEVAEAAEPVPAH